MENYRSLSLRLLYALYGADSAYYLKVNKYKISYAELSIMYVLDNSDFCSQKTIVDMMCIAPTTVNTIIKNWEKQGYVTQNKINGKKREKQIVLTNLGKEYLSSFLQDVYNKEDMAIKKTLEKYSANFIEALEYYKDCLKESFIQE